MTRRSGRTTGSSRTPGAPAGEKTGSSGHIFVWYIKTGKEWEIFFCERKIRRKRTKREKIKKERERERGTVTATDEKNR